MYGNFFPTQLADTVVQWSSHDYKCNIKCHTKVSTIFLINIHFQVPSVIK